MDLLEQIIYVLRANKGNILKITLLFGVCIFVYLLFSYTFLTVTSDNLTQEGTLIITGASEKSTTISPQDPTKMFLIKRGTKQVKLRSGENEAESPISFGLGRAKKINLSLESQKQIKKGISGPFDCGTSQAGQYYSYKCTGKSNVISQTTTDSFIENRVVISDASAQYINPEPYLKGILALSGLTGADDEKITPSLVYSDLQSATTKNQKLPTSISASSPRELTIVPSTSGSGFLLVNTATHKVYWFESLSDQKPKLLQAFEETANTSMGVRCTLSENNVVCLQARFGSAFEDADETNSSQKPVQPKLYIFNSAGTIAAVKKIGTKTPIRQFGYGANRAYILDIQNNLQAFAATTSELNEEWMRPDIRSIVVKPSGELYLQKNDELWNVRPDQIQAHLVFRSANIRISSIQSVDNKVFIVGIINNQLDSELTHFELLTENKAKEYIEDKLPAKAGYIRELDYTATGKLFIKLRLTSYISDRSTGQFTVDQTEYNNAKQAVMKQLERDGSLAVFKTVHFSY